MSGKTPLFSNVHEEDEDLLCGRCGQTWAKPVELKPCSHIQCRHCTKGTTHCATCHVAITGTVLPHKLLLLIANDRVVRCSDCKIQMSRLASYAHHCAVPVAPTPTTTPPRPQQPRRAQVQPSFAPCPQLRHPASSSLRQPHTSNLPLDDPSRGSEAPLSRRSARKAQAVAVSLDASPTHNKPAAAVVNRDNVTPSQLDGAPLQPQRQPPPGQTMHWNCCRICDLAPQERRNPCAHPSHRQATKPASMDPYQWPHHVLVAAHCEAGRLLLPSDIAVSTAIRERGWHVYVLSGLPQRLSRVLVLDFLRHSGLVEGSGLCCLWGDEADPIATSSTRVVRRRIAAGAKWLLAYERPLTELQLVQFAVAPARSVANGLPFTFERQNARVVWNVQPTGLKLTPLCR